MDKMCHHWKGIKEACESTLSFSEDALVASFLPHHLPSLGRLLWNTLASCQRTFSFIDTFYWDRSFEDLSYWDNSFNKNHLPSLRQLLWNTLASCQRSWQANGAGADTEAAFGFVCFCRLPCLCGQVQSCACCGSDKLFGIPTLGLALAQKPLLQPQESWGMRVLFLENPSSGELNTLFVLTLVRVCEKASESVPMLSMPLAPGTGHHHQAQIRGIASIDCYQVWIRAALYMHNAYKVLFCGSPWWRHALKRLAYSNICT